MIRVEKMPSSKPENDNKTDLIFILSPHLFKKIRFNLLCRLTLNLFVGNVFSNSNDLIIRNFLEALFHLIFARDKCCNPIIGWEEFIISILSLYSSLLYFNVLLSIEMCLSTPLMFSIVLLSDMFSSPFILDE